MGLLAGCQGAPTVKLQASIGTYSAATTGRAYVLVLRPQQHPNSFSINVSGPGGYNETIILQSSSARSLSGVWWEYSWDASRALNSGSYVFSATIDGKTEQVTLNIDANSVLARPTVTVGASPTTTNVSASWNHISGANAYLVRLVNRSSGSVVARNSVTSNNTAFSNLNLNTTDSYAVEVYAASSNIASDPPGIPEQFNMSLGESSSFTVAQAP
jgi:hypothetical protein